MSVPVGVRTAWLPCFAQSTPDKLPWRIPHEPWKGSSRMVRGTSSRGAVRVNGIGHRQAGNSIVRARCCLSIWPQSCVVDACSRTLVPRGIGRPVAITAHPERWAARISLMDGAYITDGWHLNRARCATLCQCSNCPKCRWQRPSRQQPHRYARRLRSHRTHSAPIYASTLSLVETVQSFASTGRDPAPMLAAREASLGNIPRCSVRTCFASCPD